MPRPAPLQLGIHLSRAPGAAPLSDQIAAQLRAAVLAQQIRPDELVPSTRALAAVLGVARMTVDVAYAQLVAEGYLTARPGSGTRVAPQSQPALTVPRPPPAAAAAPPARQDMPPRAALFAEAARSLTVQAPVPLAISAPTEMLSPGRAWTRIAVAQARRPWQEAAYTGPYGFAPLRAQIAAYVRRMRGIRCEAGQVLVTAGTQQGLALTARVLFAAGDTVWTEDPGYIPLRTTLHEAGLRPCPVPVDGAGLDVAAGQRLAPGAAGAYVTPSHQYPLGAVLTMERRQALLHWAQQRGGWVVEDDYDSELRYGGRPIPALAGLEGAAGAVVYLGTFSKMLFPGLRLGYLIAPARLVDAFAGARLLADRHAASAEQIVLAEYLARGHYDAHIRRIRLIFATRRAELLAQCSAELDAFGAVMPGDQGMHVLFRFHHDPDDVALAEDLRRDGVEVRALSPFYFTPGGMRGLLLGFGSFDATQIRLAVQQIRHRLTNPPRG